jgi:hypothetical protein
MKSETSFTLVGAISILMWGAILPLLRLSSEGAGMLATLLVVQGVAGGLGLEATLK